MPDQNQPLNPQASAQASVPPPKPVVEEVTSPNQNDTFPPVESTSETPSEPPLGDIPPIVTSPSNKGINKKIIATVLGFLVLIGGLGAGLLLVRQQQELREKAAAPCLLCRNNICVLNEIQSACSNGLNEEGCTTEGEVCGTVTPSPTPSPGAARGPSLDCNGVCSDPAVCVPACQQIVAAGSLPASTNCTSLCSNQSQCLSTCQNPAGGGGGGSYVVGTDCAATQGEGVVYLYTAGAEIKDYWCPNATSLGSGCSENESSRGVQQAGIYTVNTSGKCGIFQIDAFYNGSAVLGCGSYKYVACAGTPTPTPAGSAQCLNVQAYDTSWTKITDLSKLKAGDKVRFTVAGSSTTGTIDKARFKINGVLRADVTQTKPNSTPPEFYDEYTIPAGVTSFSVTAELHHSSFGWF